MKIIFLDIDGVLNHADFLYDRADRAEAGEHLHPDGAIDPECVEHLNAIIEATGAKVVVSSTWRLFRSCEKLQWCLDQKGFSGEVIGKTTSEDMETRGLQIDQWVRGHEVGSFVILDDDLDVYPHADRHVKTDFMHGGLQGEHAERAIEMLGGGE